MFSEDIIDRARFENGGDVDDDDDDGGSETMAVAVAVAVEVTVNEEPVELPAEPVIWPAIVKMQKGEEKEGEEAMKWIGRERGIDFVTVAPVKECVKEGVKEEEIEKEKEKSPLVRKVGKAFVRIFKRGGNV